MEELSPCADPQIQQDNADAVQVREKFLRIESHLKAFALLIMVLSLMVLAARIMLGKVHAREFGMSVIPWFQIAFGSLPFMVGLGLYFLKRWAGVVIGIFAVVVIGINVTQLPSGLIEIIFQMIVLRFLLSAGSRRVFSRDYQGIIRQTPTIKSHAASWIRPGIVILVLLVAALFVLR